MARSKRITQFFFTIRCIYGYTTIHIYRLLFFIFLKVWNIQTARNQKFWGIWKTYSTFVQARPDRKHELSGNHLVRFFVNWTKREPCPSAPLQTSLGWGTQSTLLLLRHLTAKHKILFMLQNAISRRFHTIVKPERTILEWWKTGLPGFNNSHSWITKSTVYKIQKILSS